MRLIRRQDPPRLREEDGYSMLAVIGAIALITLAGQPPPSPPPTATSAFLRRDIDQKRAYAAAQAGIADYTYHLNNDSGYWARCTGVPAPNAVNLT